ncbi:hypothetical protein MMC18_008399 [Xylographa bjoerkii]|nr:hypothetical protein [Xylographa bjoerkii]
MDSAYSKAMPEVSKVGRQRPAPRYRGEQNHRITKRSLQPTIRKSARLQKRGDEFTRRTFADVGIGQIHSLPSPATSDTYSKENSPSFLLAKVSEKKEQAPSQDNKPEEVERLRRGSERYTPRELGPKRKRPQEAEDSTSRLQDEPTQKRTRVWQSDREAGDTKKYQAPKDLDCHPVKYWVVNDRWPESFGQDAVIMSQNTASKQTSDSQNSSSKRKTESTHRSDRIERLAENGVFMKNSALTQRSSKELCKSYLQGGRVPKWWPSYPPDKIAAILDRIDGLNEGRIQRDIMPLVVPSAENLFYCDEPIEDWIGDDVHAEWTRSATMGSTRPKPDYTAGLLRKAFTKDENDKLRNYASPLRPFLFTPELSFPFLICEAKSGEEGLNKAHRQNIHSASIAVRAIIELYREAFGESDPDRVNKLYGQILVFTISHNHNMAHLHGHYAVISEDFPEKLEFYRYEIALFSLTLDDGQSRFRTYNFVQNVYENFAPEHRKRIKDAVAHLKSPGERTRLNFSASSSALEESDSQANSQETPQEPMASSSQERAGFKKPPLPPSVIVQKENERLRDQVDILLRQQQEQQRQQQEQQRQQQENIGKLQDMLAEQKEQNKEQMGQYKEIINMLRQQMSTKG